MHKVSLGFCRPSLGKTGPEKVAFGTCVLFFFFFCFCFLGWKMGLALWKVLQPHKCGQDLCFLVLSAC